MPPHLLASSGEARVDASIQPETAILLTLAAHQSPPGWAPFSRAGIAAPYPGRFHRKDEPLPSYLALAEDPLIAAQAALDEFLAQHDPGDPEAPDLNDLARRLSIFRVNGSEVLVADGVDTLTYLGADAQSIDWSERSSWEYCQEAASRARTLELDGIVCSSAVYPKSCRTVALFNSTDTNILVPQLSLEGRVSELQRRILEGLL